ncbi:MAG: Gfo/Idh/MocA family oxidoreductase [Bacteroidia bacterium]
MKYFAITGVAGYIAPRHLKAIHDTGNRLVAAVDPHDSVGILDRYSSNVAFFTEFERFDRHLERLKRDPNRPGVDYLTICAPNYLHDAHIRLALRVGCDAICEKPLVATPWHLDALAELEAESSGKIYNILQLRVHESLIKLKEKFDSEKRDKKYQLELTYITSRGPWYHYSWKGDEDKSGGIATNIGIHFFDMLIWLFGKPQHSEVYLREKSKMGGMLELENAEVSWFLSIDKSDLPEEIAAKGQPTYRSIKYDGEEIEFSEGFTDLHTKMYEAILDGRGFGIEDARPSIELVHKIRTSPIISNMKVGHPFIV